MRLDQLELVVGELARLVDDLGGDLDLPDVVQQRNELRVTPLAAVDAQPLADVEH